MILNYFVSDWSRSQEPPLHRNTGSTEPDSCRFLADGLGTGLRRHCHADQTPGQRLPSLPSLLARGRFREISHFWGTKLRRDAFECNQSLNQDKFFQEPFLNCSLTRFSSTTGSSCERTRLVRRLPREVRLPEEHAYWRDTNGHAVPLQVVAGTGRAHIHQGTSWIQEVNKILCHWCCWC